MVFINLHVTKALPGYHAFPSGHDAYRPLSRSVYTGTQLCIET